MSFRCTGILFVLLFAMLWLFGLMLAHKKTQVDESAIVPTLQKAPPDMIVESVTVERHDKDKEQAFQFTQDFERKDEKDGVKLVSKDVWTYRKPDAKSAVKVETFRINQMVNQIKDARKNDEVSVSDSLSDHGLDKPSMVVTLKGVWLQDQKEKTREWKFFIGKESADKAFRFVNSSDRPQRVFAVSRGAIDSLFFTDPNHLRSRRIFDFSDVTAKSIEVKEGSDILELKKEEDATWRFVKPSLGFADFEGPNAPKEKEPPIGVKSPEGGVKGLLSAISSIRVDTEDDFVAAGDATPGHFGLEDGKETMRIEVGTPDGNKVTKETLLIGQRTNDKGRDQYYARLKDDQGVFRLNAKLLEPIRNYLKNPGQLRSLDIGHVDIKKVDVVSFGKGKDEVRLVHREDKGWQVVAGTDSPKNADGKAVDAFLEALQGKRAIVKFFDEGDWKKLDAELGFDNPQAEVALYVDGLDKDKKDEKKDDKKDAKDKKDDKKKDDAPQLKKDAKPAVTLVFGKNDKEHVNVKRVLADGTISRFTVAKALLDKAAPFEGAALAFLDTGLPNLSPQDVTRIEITGGKTKIAVARGTGDKAQRWYFQEGKNDTPADTFKTQMLINQLTLLDAKRWVKKADAKEDLDKYGLGSPALTVTFWVKKSMPASSAAAALGLLSTPSPWRPFLVHASVVANRETAKGEPITFKLGKEADYEKGALFAQRSDHDMLFLVPDNMAKSLREADLRDRTTVYLTVPYLATALLGMEAAQPYAAVFAAAPPWTNEVHRFDPDKVESVKLSIRTREELRNFAFTRAPQAAAKEKEKDKDKEKEKERLWTDSSGLMEFQLDSAKVNQLVEQLAKLKAERWVSIAGGPQSDQKLGAKDSTLKIDLGLAGGQTVTLTVGAGFERGMYYAHSTLWPDAVFFVPGVSIDPILRGVSYFGKDRVAAAN
ncbi:MAG: DUF4340 domain-containing protein [Gemmataceae bacterium]|nr:DUF4340 domain-containing protein [Gemmataceae bacterium]